MIIDVSDESGAWRRFVGASIRVDGVEIPGLIYVDTEAGFVKTVSVFFDASEVEIARAVHLNQQNIRTEPRPRARYMQRGWQRDTLPARFEMEWAEDVTLPLTRIIRGFVTIEFPAPVCLPQ